MIDASKHHNPAKAPGLIAEATSIAGGQKELAVRLGVTARTLRQLSRRERDMSYTMQVALEQIVNSA